jgi:hypothetical protein
MLYKNQQYQKIENVSKIDGYLILSVQEYSAHVLCLIACGYSQVPGIDFQDFYSPVVNDAVICIIIIL